MKTEISAGGAIIKKINNLWQILLIRDTNNQWTFPKGLIEIGENPELAARREVAEEIGLTGLKLTKSLTPIHYSYMRGELIEKTVNYFLFTLEAEQNLVPQAEEGITEGRWMDLEEAKKLIGYPDTNSQILKEVENYISRR